MNEEGLFVQVKENLRTLLKDYGEGDSIQVISFDREARLEVDQVIQDSRDLSTVLARVDHLQANGNYTDLIGALDASLNHVSELRKNNPNIQTTLVLYTDGKHAPPPERRDASVGSFPEIFKTYYQGYEPGKGWFIYYVELREKDEELEAFLQQTKSGSVVTRKVFDQGIDFTQVQVPRPMPFLLGGVLCLVIFILFYRRLPWFPGAILGGVVGTGERVDLSSFSRPWFRRSLVVGKEGSIRIHGAGVENLHARIGVTWKGLVYVSPLQGTIKVSGQQVRGKTILSSGDRVSFGRREYLYKES